MWGRKIEITDVKMSSFFCSSNQVECFLKHSMRQIEEDVGKTTLTEKHQLSEGTRRHSKAINRSTCLFCSVLYQAFVSLSQR